MREKEWKAKIKKMSAGDRINHAKERTDEMWQYMVRLIQTHKNNSIIMYTDTLTSQIGRSYAAHAFNDFQQTMWLGELVKLTAMWDRLDLDKYSIPTVVALIDDPGVCRRLYRAQAIGARNLGNQIDWSDVPEAKAARSNLFRRELERVRSGFEEQWRAGVERGKAIAGSAQLKGVNDYRNSEFAHNLRKQPYSSVPAPIPMKYGDEKELLLETIFVVNGLNGVVRNAHFDYDGSLDIAERSASSLWQSCKFVSPA